MSFFRSKSSTTPPDEESILNCLRKVKYPGFSRNIVSFGLVKKVHCEENQIHVQLKISTTEPEIPVQIKKEIASVLQSTFPGFSPHIQIDLQQPAGPASPNEHATGITGIKHILAVASGKGGVGKSTVASNLAVSLQKMGHKVGLCDCDLYGPSVGVMFGTSERPYATSDNRIIPIERHKLKLMSMGFLLDDNAPAVLRGPMVTRYTQQFLRSVEWGNLDFLILDLPPGTGDIQLTIVQTVALDGAIIVTTPQEVALIDARKAASMFEKVNTPVLGLIENMSVFICPDTGKSYPIFGEGGGAKEAERLQVPLLGQIPIEMSTRQAGDEGTPASITFPDSKSAQIFSQIATTLTHSLTAS